MLSISFEDVPTGKVGSNLLFSSEGESFLGGSGGMPPQENFETWMLGNAIFNVFQTVFGP